jgi:glycosyltransferase involved in cell wall biosynthesis
MQAMGKNILIVRTHYPHWAKHSGYHQFIRYLSREEFVVNVEVVPMGDNHFPLSNGHVRASLKYMIKKSGASAYELNDFIAELSVMKKWWSRGFDLVHYLDGEHSTLLLPLLFRIASLFRSVPPVIATYHQPPEMLSSPLVKRTVRLLDHVVVFSEEQKTYFEQFLPTHNISVILHGVDADYYRPAARPKEPGKLRCISVGSWLRDYRSVIEVAKILESYADIEFHIVSSDLAKFDLPNNVYSHGRLDDVDLVRMYQESDVLFIPFLSATANNVLLEGIACGLPVVSSDLPAVKAYLPGKEAILVKDNNHELLARALLGLSLNRDRLVEMGIQARQRSLELSWKNIVPQLESLYSELLSRCAK